MDIEEIFNNLRRGITLSPEEMAFYNAEMQRFVSNGQIKSSTKSLTADEQRALFDEGQAIINGSPALKRLQRDSIAEKQETRFGKRYKPFFDAILAGADIASSVGQLRDSKNAIRDLKRPGMPAIPGMDPVLDNNIRNAEVGTMDAARAAAPAMQELQDQYGQDIAMAKSVGGGQASTLGALSQVASMRRARGAASLVPLVDSVRAREQGRLDNLTQTRLNQRQQNYYNRARQSELNLDQYNQDATAAGNLGSVARMNMRNSAQSLLNQAPRVMARFDRGYNDKYSVYEQMINKSLTRPPQSQQNWQTRDDDPSMFYNPF